MAETIVTVEYRDIPGFPGYRVGSDGSVWTQWLREPLRGGGKTGTRAVLGSSWKQKVCNRPAKSGHPRVNIKGRVYSVHRLILLAFVGECPDGCEACHNDGNPANNALPNLRWDTRKSNVGDRLRHGTLVCGEAFYAAKLTAEAVRRIRAAYQSGETSQGQLAKEYGVGRSTIEDVVCRRTWKSVK